MWWDGNKKTPHINYFDLKIVKNICELGQLSRNKKNSSVGNEQLHILLQDSKNEA